MQSCTKTACPVRPVLLIRLGFGSDQMEHDVWDLSAKQQGVWRADILWALSAGRTACVLDIAAASMLSCVAVQRLRAHLVITLLVLTSAKAIDGAALAPAAQITFDISKGHAMAERLWGIFFEEV